MKEKNKFKVGDTVIGNDLANGRYNYTTKGWKGVVKKVYPDGYFESGNYKLNPECFDLLEAEPEPEVETGINYEIY